MMNRKIPTEFSIYVTRVNCDSCVDIWNWVYTTLALDHRSPLIFSQLIMLEMLTAIIFGKFAHRSHIVKNSVLCMVRDWNWATRHAVHSQLCGWGGMGVFLWQFSFLVYSKNCFLPILSFKVSFINLCYWVTHWLTSEHSHPSCDRKHSKSSIFRETDLKICIV